LRSQFFEGLVGHALPNEVAEPRLLPLDCLKFVEDILQDVLGVTL
jgi:hypothetical protein